MKTTCPIICKPISTQRQFTTLHTRTVRSLGMVKKYLSHRATQNLPLTQGKGYLMLRDKLRERNIQLSFAGSSKFKIAENGRLHFFTDTNDLSNFLDGAITQDMDHANSFSNILFLFVCFSSTQQLNCAYREGMPSHSFEYMRSVFLLMLTHVYDLLLNMYT